MSNRAYLLFRSETGTGNFSTGEKSKPVRLLEIPLIDDFTIDITSNFQKASDIVGGGALDTVQRLMGFYSATTGSAPSMKFLFDLLVWENTEPFKINLEAIFYAKYDPVADVLEPVLDLLSMCMLSVKGNNYYVPGVSLRTLKKFWKLPESTADKKKGVDTEEVKPLSNNLEDVLASGVDNSYKTDFAKVALLWIPGVILLEKAIVTSVKPTFSKEITENEVPLWAKVDIEVSSVMPANTGDMTRDYNMYRKSFSEMSAGHDLMETKQKDTKRVKMGKVQRFYFKNFGGY